MSDASVDIESSSEDRNRASSASDAAAEVGREGINSSIGQGDATNLLSCEPTSADEKNTEDLLHVEVSKDPRSSQDSDIEKVVTAIAAQVRGAFVDVESPNEGISRANSHCGVAGEPTSDSTKPPETTMEETKREATNEYVDIDVLDTIMSPPSMRDDSHQPPAQQAIFVSHGTKFYGARNVKNEAGYVNMDDMEATLAHRPSAAQLLINLYIANAKQRFEMAKAIWISYRRDGHFAHTIIYGSILAYALFWLGKSTKVSCQHDCPEEFWVNPIAVSLQRATPCVQFACMCMCRKHQHVLDSHPQISHPLCLPRSYPCWSFTLSC